MTIGTIKQEKIFKLVRLCESKNENMEKQEKARGLKVHPLKDVVLGGTPSVNRKLLTHILTKVPTHTQTSELDDSNKLSLWLSLKRKVTLPIIERRYVVNLYIFRFTQRVTEFIKVLDDLNKGKYERTMLNSENGKSKFTSFNI